MALMYSPRKFFILLSAMFLMNVAASSTYAGFEWIPPAAVPEARIQPERVVPAPAVVPTVPMQIPTNASPPPPVFSEQPATTLPLEPLPGLEPVGAPIAQKQAPIMVEQEPQPVMRVKRVAKKPSPVSPRYTPAEPVSPPVNAPVLLQPSDIVAPPPMAAMPANTIVVPNDAPASASKALKITSFPSEQELATTQAEPLFETEPMPMVAPLAPAPPLGLEVVEGFASDVPLALALRQVVPPQYGFSFGPGVNPGYRVSWSGGQPWDQIIQAMVSDLNYGVQIGTRTVVISAL